MSRGWHGCDLDGTLAHYDGGQDITHIGEPIPRMLARVKAWIANGEAVRLVTARANPRNKDFEAFVKAWVPWSLRHLGVILPVTCEKDFDMIDLYDDRAVQIIANTGERADGLGN